MHIVTYSLNVLITEDMQLALIKALEKRQGCIQITDSTKEKSHVRSIRICLDENLLIEDVFAWGATVAALEISLLIDKSLKLEEINRLQ